MMTREDHLDMAIREFLYAEDLIERDAARPGRSQSSAPLVRRINAVEALRRLVATVSEGT